MFSFLPLVKICVFLTVDYKIGVTWRLGNQTTQSCKGSREDAYKFEPSREDPLTKSANLDQKWSKLLKIEQKLDRIMQIFGKNRNLGCLPQPGVR